VVRVFVPLREQGQAISGYVEGTRLVPQWQVAQIRADAFKIAWLVGLAVCAVGAALCPLVFVLFSVQQRRAKEVLTSHISMMEALGRAIAKRDSDTSAHNYRVAWISANLAQEVGLHGGRMQALIAGSFLHDVGKIGIPEAILNKPDRLNETEMAIMRTHVSMGEEMVAGEGWLVGGQAVVAGHHEKWDGSGYPRGLSGDEIPLVARIFAIADVFDTLCSKRPYKDPMTFDQVMQVLHAESGQHFDPHLVKVFSSLASSLYKTLTTASEDDLRAKLERMVEKHFVL
jgi:HD-GYP domain-containing protein (c-di-GMP phosphodiesterase class II)